jgi:hypothetical protein
MPKDIYKHLRHVWVCGRKLGLSRLAAGGAKVGDDVPAPAGRAVSKPHKGGRKPKPIQRAPE